MSSSGKRVDHKDIIEVDLRKLKIQAMESKGFCQKLLEFFLKFVMAALFLPSLFFFITIPKMFLMAGDEQATEKMKILAVEILAVILCSKIVVTPIYNILKWLAKKLRARKRVEIEQKKVETDDEGEINREHFKISTMKEFERAFREVDFVQNTVPINLLPDGEQLDRLMEMSPTQACKAVVSYHKKVKKEEMYKVQMAVDKSRPFGVIREEEEIDMEERVV